MTYDFGQPDGDAMPVDSHALPGEHRPVISMVVATLGRSDEILRLLASLSRQAHHDFEVILVDQNPDDRIGAMLNGRDYPFALRHLHTDRRGVCRARNLGARHATGEWLLFPDDDCWYPQNMVAIFDQMRLSTPADIYCGRAAAENGEDIMGNFLSGSHRVDRNLVWHTLIEWMTFFHRDLYAACGGFDENLGPGSGTPIGAYEIQDLVLRCLDRGAGVQFDSRLSGHHPIDPDQGSPNEIRKMRNYCRGLGYVLRRHGFGLRMLLPYLVRPGAGIFIYVASGKLKRAKRSAAILLGRLEGWHLAGRPA